MERKLIIEFLTESRNVLSANEGGIDTVKSNDDQLTKLNSLPDGGIGWREIGKIGVSNEEIAKGSNGTIVLKGTYEKRPAAVKRLVRAHYSKASKEINNLIEVDGHNNIVRYYGVEYDEHFVYLALERCICNLDDLIQAHSVSSNNSVSEIREMTRDVNLWSADGYPSPQLLKLMRDVVSELSHLHELRMIHRDLKPQNVLITKNALFGAKLSDMGISKCLQEGQSSLGKCATGCGTTGWRAPDQHQKPAMDVFSLGCVLFFCITRGRHPFGKTIEHDFNIAHNKEDLSSVEFIPEAHDLILCLLNRDPKSRPKASEVLHHPFFWNSYMRLKFLHDVSEKVEAEAEEAKSDHPKASGAVTHKVESEAGKGNSGLLEKLEDIAQLVFDGDWIKEIEKDVKDDLCKRRRYDKSSVRDLLRRSLDRILMVWMLTSPNDSPDS